MARPKRPSNLIDELASLPSPAVWALLAAAAVLLIGWLVVLLFDPLLPLLIATILAYACSPLADRLERHGWTRTAAAMAMLLGLALTLALTLALLLPTLIGDGKDMLHRFPDYARLAIDKVLVWGQGLGLELPERDAVLSLLNDRLVGMKNAFFHGDLSLPKAWVDSARGALALGFSLLLVPVLFFFVLRDLHLFQHQGLQWVPPRHRSLARRLYATADQIFAGYVRGQLTLSLLLSVVFSIGLTLMGIRYGLLIGILAGFLNLVPYVGQITGLLLALMMAMVDFTGWGRVLALPIFFGTVNFLESTLVTPNVVGNKVGLTPLQSLLALLVGGSLFGVLGMLTAIPLTGLAKAWLKELKALYVTSKLYGG